MIFPDKIKSISKTDRVLEVGPGSAPYPKADVYLEKRFEAEESFAQQGFALGVKPDKPIIYYDSGKFPFQDKEFDYVVCSHVIEHLPRNELDLFLSELQRVASKGYIEFPTVYYELINYQPVHQWFMNFRDDKILFLNKSIFTSGVIHEIYRSMFYDSEGSAKKLFRKYSHLFFFGYEWDKTISYKIVSNYEDLVNIDDLKKWKLYFKTIKKNAENNMSYMKNGKLKYFVTNYINKIKDCFASSEKNVKGSLKISLTAIIENKDLVELGDNVEIQDYVIIKTYREKVIVGKNSQLNPFTIIYGGEGIYIGNNVMIGPHCVLVGGQHDYKQVETPMRFAGNMSTGPINIQDDVWIGANCTITDGVNIGKGAVVGANSVVTHDIEAYSIVAGVPAKIIDSRLKGKK